MTINPSVGEGLGFCTPAQYAKEKTFSIEGEGCPADSKVGTLHLTRRCSKEASTARSTSPSRTTR